MPRWSPAAAAIALGVVLVLVLGLGLGSLAARWTAGAPAPTGAAGRSPTPSPSAPAAPALLRDCWIPTPEGSVALSADEAKRLTSLAASRHKGPRGAKRLLRVVRRELPEATSRQSRVVAASLLGRRSTDRLACGYSRSAVEPEKPGRSGLTPRAVALRAGWTDVFGPLIAGGFASAGVRSGHVDGSSHYDGRAIDVFFRPHTDPEQRRAGRVFAQWLVAHAADYSILSIIYADQIWTSWASFAGWRPYDHPSGSRNAVLRHLDHVHVAVESGEPYRRP